MNCLGTRFLRRYLTRRDLTRGRRRGTAGDRIHLRQNLRSFNFQSTLHVLKITIRKFSSTMFEFQVAQVLVNCVAALH